MKTKKLLSLILSVIMIMSVLPMYASAADPIALTDSNIVTYPTAEYINDGVMYYGQKVGDAISFSGGEVQYNGVTVAGHFEPVDINTVPTSTGTQRADIKFVPDDETSYTGFESKRCRYVTYTVSKTTPVFVDAENDPIVATEVEAGAKLSTSILSGGKMVNPYNADEANIAARAWEWYNGDYEPSNTIVTTSGYYKAMFVPIGYEMITEWVLVRVKGDTSEVKMGSTIEELPTVDGTVRVGDHYRDIKLTGGKAVGMEGEELSGTFLIDRDGTINSLNVSPNVKFIPDDERYASSESRLTIDVEPGPIKFVDENGNAIIPEITVPYGTKVNDIEPRLKTLATNCDETLFYDLSANDDVSLTVGTHTLEVLVFPSKTVGVTPNYLDTTLTFKVVVEPIEFAVNSVAYNAAGEFISITTDYAKAPGTYDVYVDGVLAGSGLKYGASRVECPWQPEVSGTYNVKVVYNPTENDNCFMADYETEIQVNVARDITTEGLNSTLKVNGSQYYPVIANGDEISVECVLPDVFAGWEITDTNGNVIDLGVDLTANKITFTMPDQDIVVKAKSTLDEEEKPDDGTGDGTDNDANNGIFGGIWSFFQKLIDWFMNIIKQMMSLFGLGA